MKRVRNLDFRQGRNPAQAGFPVKISEQVDNSVWEVENDARKQGAMISPLVRSNTSYIISRFKQPAVLDCGYIGADEACLQG